MYLEILGLFDLAVIKTCKVHFCVHGEGQKEHCKSMYDRKTVINQENVPWLINSAFCMPAILY